MTPLSKSIQEANKLLEEKKPKLESLDPQVADKVKKAAILYMKDEQAFNALVDGFGDWFEAVGKRKVMIKDSDYMLDDLDDIMAIVRTELEKQIKG